MTLNIDNERKRWLLVCVAIVGFGVVLLFLLTALKSTPQLTPIVNRTPIIDAEPLVWQNGKFEISASGRVVPVAMVKLQAQVTGKVIEVSDHLKSGAHFKSGMTLLKIDPISFKAKTAELGAQLASAKADLKLAHSQMTRSQKLLKLKAASQEELDQRQAALGTARARVAQFEASLLNAKADLNRSAIKAPFDGRVISETVSVGDILAPGMPFADIYSTEAFELSVALAESDAVLLDNLFSTDTSIIEARIEATFGGSQFYWPAIIDRVEAGIDNVTRTIDVVVRIEAPEKRGQALQETDVEAPPLLSSMFAKAFIETRDVGRYVKVNRDSVRSNNTVWFVQVNSEGIGKVHIANVKTLSNQQQTSYISPDIANENNVYILGSDIGAVLPGNLVQIRNHPPEIKHAKVVSNKEVVGPEANQLGILEAPLESGQNDSNTPLATETNTASPHTDSKLKEQEQ